MSSNNQGLGLNGLLSFLDYVCEKHLMKTATARSWKAACNQVFGILSSEEQDDLSSIDLDSVFYRFENKNAQQFSPSSLTTYKSRVRKALDEFLKFKDNPSSWRPSLDQRTSRRVKTKQQETTKSNNRSNTYVSTSPPKNEYHNTEIGMTHNYPLREGITVKISGLPRDLKLNEAKRIGAFLTTLCEDFDPSTN